MDHHAEHVGWRYPKPSVSPYTSPTDLPTGGQLARSSGGHCAESRERLWQRAVSARSTFDIVPLSLAIPPFSRVSGGAVCKDFFTGAQPGRRHHGWTSLINFRASVCCKSAADAAEAERADATVDCSGEVARSRYRRRQPVRFTRRRNLG